MEMPAMDKLEFEAAFRVPYAEPRLQLLVRRFHLAFERSQGDTQTAMVAVNELLDEPIPYEVFLTRMRSE